MLLFGAVFGTPFVKISVAWWGLVVQANRSSSVSFLFLTRQPGTYTLTVTLHFEKLCVIGAGVWTFWSSGFVLMFDFISHNSVRNVRSRESESACKSLLAWTWSGEDVQWCNFFCHWISFTPMGFIIALFVCVGALVFVFLFHKVALPVQVRKQFISVLFRIDWTPLIGRHGTGACRHGSQRRNKQKNKPWKPNPQKIVAFLTNWIF